MSYVRFYLSFSSMIRPTIWLPLCHSTKIIAPRNRYDIHQSLLNVSFRWCKNWELDIRPTKSEQLAIGNSLIPSLTPSRPKTQPKIRQFKDILQLKTWTALPTMTLGCYFIWQDPWRLFAQTVFFPCVKLLSGDTSSTLFKHSLSSCEAT